MGSSKIIVGLRNFASYDHIYPTIKFFSKTFIPDKDVLFIITDVQYFIQNTSEKDVIKNFVVEEHERKFKSFYYFLNFSIFILKFVTSTTIKGFIITSLNRCYSRLLELNLGIIFKEVNISHVITDHCNNLFFKIISTEKKRNHLKIISMPHGMNFFRNILLNHNDFDFDIATKSSSFLNLADCIVVNHSNHKKAMINSGVDSQKIQILPSVRFNSQFLRSPFHVAKQTSQFKILFIVPKTVSNVNERELSNVIYLLKQRFGDSVAFKFHPSLSTNYQKKNGNITSPKEDTSALINWSELVFFVDSSVIVQAIIQKKVCVLLNHVHNNDLEFLDLNIMDITNTRDDFIKLINCYNKNMKLYKSNYHLRYSKNIDTFIKQNRLDASNNVLSNAYCQLISE